MHVIIVKRGYLDYDTRPISLLLANLRATLTHTVLPTYRDPIGSNFHVRPYKKLP